MGQVGGGPGARDTTDHDSREVHEGSTSDLVPLIPTQTGPRSLLLALPRVTPVDTTISTSRSLLLCF